MKKLVVATVVSLSASAALAEISIETKAGHSYGHHTKDNELKYQGNSFEVGGQYLFSQIAVPVSVGGSVSRTEYSKKSSAFTGGVLKGKSASELDLNIETRVYAPASLVGESVKPYAKLGHSVYSDMTVKTDLTVADQTTKNKLTGTNHKMVVGLGAGYQITDELGVSAEYTYSQGKMKLKAKGGERSDIKTASHSGAVGVSYTI